MLAAPSFDFVFLLLAQESPSKLGSPFARSSVPTLGRVSKLSLLSLIGNVEFHSTFPTLGRVSKLSLLSLIGNVV